MPQPLTRITLSLTVPLRSPSIPTFITTVPAAVWGIVLLFLGLATHLVPLSAVRDAGTFLTKIMPVLFVAPAVDLMDCWDLVRDNWIGIALVVVLSTVITFAVSGRICQGLIRKEDEHHG